MAPARHVGGSAGVHRRRRVVLIVCGLLLVVVTAAGYQAWQVVDAIVNAQRVAVVPWSTRESIWSAGVTSMPTSTAMVLGVTDPLAGATSTTVNVAISPTIAVDATMFPVATEPLAQGSSEQSRFGVVRDLLGASTESGDPGRSPVWGGRTAINILVIGVDRRPEGGDENADVLIVAHVDLINKRVAAVSLPRDLLVDIPGFGPGKINGSYNLGMQNHPEDLAAGVTAVRDTIESVFGVPLDGYVMIDFEGFTRVVDSVDGIQIDVPYEIIDEEYPTDDYGTELVHFGSGLQHMTGEQALKYVRTRHGDSDDERRDRQYQVLLALFDTGKSISSLTKVDDLIVALGGAAQTSFPLDQQLALARVGLQIDRADIRLSVLGPPLLEPGYTGDGQWVYVGAPSEMAQFVQTSLNTDPAMMAERSTPAPMAIFE